MPIAVVYVPADEYEYARFGNQCLAYCEARGYEFAGVIRGNLRAVHAMLGNGTADVGVIARPDHAHLDGEPRIEVANLDAPVDVFRRRPTNVGVTLRPAVPPLIEPGLTSRDIMRRNDRRRRPR